MSTPDLPQDMHLWPADPYALLGVAEGVSQRDLKRAYTSLIRTYKPEQFPEQFRRIREAYEEVLGRVKLAEFAAAHGTPAAPVEPREPVPDLPQPADPSLPSQLGHLDRVASKSATPAEQLDELWELACAGQETAAYSHLVRWPDENPDRPEGYVRLYWLLDVLPELDAERSPCDWLVQGLRRHGPASPCKDLYLRAIEERPEEALELRCTRLVREAEQPAALADLVACRWRALARLRQAERIVEDMNALRDRIVREDEVTWFRLLLAAADLLAWVPPANQGPLLESCKREIDQFTHLSLRFEQELNRLEFLVQLSTGWNGLRREDQDQLVWQLRRLIPLSWCRPFAEVRPVLYALLHHVVGNPRRALEWFDRILAQAPAVLTHFAQLLDFTRSCLDHPPEETRSADDLGRLLQRFFLSQSQRDYPSLRPPFLDYCLSEAIPPEILQHIGDLPELTRDFPFYCVCAAHRLFWSS
jgi:hypothetical protein